MKTLSVLVLLSLAACAEEAIEVPPANDPPTETSTDENEPTEVERDLRLEKSKVVLRQVNVTKADPRTETSTGELQR